MKLLIDNRETYLLNVATIYQQQQPSFQFEEVPLDLGDILIQQDSFRILIERKTLNDLAASIRDGRWREQKKRLLGYRELYPQTKLCYLIEGTMPPNESFSINRMSYQAVLSGMIHACFRDQIMVYKTKNLQESFSFLKGLAHKMVTKPEQLGFTNSTQTSASPLEYNTSLIKIKKKENLTPPRCYELMLAQIPGISYKTAKRIAEVYPTMSLLFQTFQKEPEKTRMNCLSNIPKIGKKTSQTIYNFLQL